MSKNMLALGRLKSGVMNKTESEYATFLEAQKRAGKIQHYLFEGYTLKLAQDTRYTPDFMVLTNDGIMQFHEVKGYWTDDAKVKVKVASDKFPHEFVIVKKLAKKDGGGFSFEVVK